MMNLKKCKEWVKTVDDDETQFPEDTENIHWLISRVEELEAADYDYSDAKRKGLFAGNGLDYIRMRATKHIKVYASPKQANHLRRLATDIESRIEELEEALRFYAQEKHYKESADGSVHIIDCGEVARKVLEDK